MAVVSLCREVFDLFQEQVQSLSLFLNLLNFKELLFFL